MSFAFMARIILPEALCQMQMMRFFVRVVALASLVAMCGCARSLRPPYTLAFALDGGAPRVLVASQELAVPLTLTNTGTREWNPPRIHLSYHWVWFIPRELPARSRWDVPYHNGIRTELAGAVAAGGRLGVQ